MFLIGMALSIALYLMASFIIWLSENPKVIQWVTKVVFAIWAIVAVILFFKSKLLIGLGWVSIPILILIMVLIFKINEAIVERRGN